jgi:diadenosine tetraphosphate (Ap4A) HIT family hydrolase
MASVAQAVFEAFKPRKLNYELLGNGAPHLHWHLFPRHADDPRPKGPVWEDEEFLRLVHAGAQEEPEQVEALKARLLAALETSDLTIEKRF